MASTTTEQAAETAGHGAETASAGMPQLDFSTFPNQIFWLLVTLVVIYFVLSRVALPRIGGVLAARKAAVTGDLQAAEALREQAVAAEKAYDEALARARADAARIVATARAEIQKDLDAATSRADEQIAAKSAEAAARLDEIRAGAAEAVAEVARDTAKEIVAALGGKGDAKAVNAAVAARLKG